MLRQFTATVYIIEKQKVLLIFHKKYKKWLPPGGHLEPNEIPTEGAKREALEETGVEVELLSQENLWLNCHNAKSIERPYLCLLEEIPARLDQPAHQHIDMIYVGRPKGGSEAVNERETDGLRWFTLAEVEALESDVAIFDETKQTIRTLLGNKYDKKAKRTSVSSTPKTHFPEVLSS